MPKPQSQMTLDARTPSAAQSPTAPSRRDVWRMFDRIAGRYDFLNRSLSLRQDVMWRRRLAQSLPAGTGLSVLDLATGTGDVLLQLCQDRGKVAHGVGVDMAANMLAIGKAKIRDRKLDGVLAITRGDASQLAVRDAGFDAVTIAFGIRNVIDPAVVLREMRRALKDGGRALVLEFSLPSNALVRAAYLFYFRHVLPRIGALISGDAHAYRYLNTTVESFPYGQAFCDLMVTAGFANVKRIPLTLGIATLYTGDK
ncbi:MAG: bifunctional demethylmenaquinone methyltransferase/2-methoxy-6-polyprenyl-1,4-benzoquinol methylase UbiE [Candidatus Hydrogenedentes bacterium]|nr:bifunctional demethylmenaquinone methyltransferase/2-methoxy-6-polyprenyl-1,4-benzoquinol methylase UbiE [Candidatus Hydrogenedentota bacterium]